MRKKFVIGINKEEKEIIIGEMEITTRNGYKEFSASFDVGTAFDIEEVQDDDYIEEYCSDYWDCLDADSKLELLYDGDRTKEEAFEDMFRYADYHDIKDCSCTDIEIEIEDGTTINFETTCGGQHDIRDDKDYYKNIVFTDKKAVELLLELWDEYHLKSIEDNAEIEEQINYVIEKLEKYTMYSDDTEKFIKENIKEL